MPIVSVWLNSESVSEKVGYVTRAGLLGGLVGGVFIVVFWYYRRNFGSLGANVIYSMAKF